jgi:hypothetical protein
VEIDCHMLAECGQSGVSERKVCEWVGRFKLGKTRVADERRSGRPSTPRTQGICRDYRRQTDNGV